MRRICCIAVAVLSIAPVGCRHAPRASAEAVILDWRSDDAAQRERASERAVAEGRGWTDADVDLLRRACADPDVEVAARAKEALSRIEPRRALGAKVEEVEALVRELATPAGKLRCVGIANPEGPLVETSAAMKKLAALGPAIEPLLIEHLGDKDVRNELGVVLAGIGGLESVGALIDALPDKEGQDGYWLDYGVSCLVYGYVGGWDAPEDWGGKWDPQVRARWKAWYSEHAPYLYAPDPSTRDPHRMDQGRVEVDLEAEVAGVPHAEYRAAHPEIPEQAIAKWSDAPEYAARLRAHCVSLLVDEACGKGEALAMLSLPKVDDPLARNAIRWLRNHPDRFPRMKDWVDQAFAEMTQEVAPAEAAPQPDPSVLALLRKGLQADSADDRVRSAVALWRHGNREGACALVEALRLRPLTGSNLILVRRACEALGQMGEASAIPDLRLLLQERLDGGNPLGIHGTQLYGRPDAVALVRLGDPVGVGFIQEAIMGRDPYYVTGGWPATSDLEDLGMKSFLPLLVPRLRRRKDRDSVNAARTIVRLLDHGR